jgi:hypothetical protein
LSKILDINVCSNKKKVFCGKIDFTKYRTNDLYIKLQSSNDGCKTSASTEYFKNGKCFNEPLGNSRFYTCLESSGFFRTRSIKILSYDQGNCTGPATQSIRDHEVCYGIGNIGGSYSCVSGAITGFKIIWIPTLFAVLISLFI